MRSKDQIILEEIYTREILNEKRKERLLPMFNKIIQKLVDLEEGFPLQYDDRYTRSEFQNKGESEEEYRKGLKEFNREELTSKVQKLIKEVSVTAKKENLVMIILKSYLGVMEREYKGMAEYGVIFDGTVDEEGDEATSSKDYFYEHFKSFIRNGTKLEHMLSLPIPELQEYLRTVSPNEKWHMVAQMADYMEREWKAQMGSWMDVTEDIQNGSIQEIIPFGNNMAWFDLKRPYCKEEGEAMGHCGNAASKKKDDTVLSLRESKKQKNNVILSKPHLTFILMRGAFLGEMKGRGNSKPQTKHHPYIMELLMHKKEDGKYLVKGIDVGFGYKPENNFDIEDLSDSDLQKLANERILLIADKVQDYMIKEQQISPKLKAAMNKSTDKENLINEIKVRAKSLDLMKTHISSLNKLPNVVSIKQDFTIRYRGKMTPEQVADVALNA